MGNTNKRTVSDILIDRFLKDVEEKGTMPWQRPYERYNAFNYFSLNPYRGFNRIMLPFGEYLTRNQINEYNRSKGTNYRFKQGIKWYPVIFFKVDKKEVSYKKIKELFPDIDGTESGFIGTDGIWRYISEDGSYYKEKNVLMYYEVADRKWFVDPEGNCLPSRLETGEVQITLSKPSEVIDSYVKRTGVKVIKVPGEVPCYKILSDEVILNPLMVDEDSWFSTAFHELSHSTGHVSRLNRKGVNCPSGLTREERNNLYAVEECIAEISASLCCAECGVYNFQTSESKKYENNLAYVQAWQKRVRDWGKELIYIVSQADKSFNYIMDMEGL